MTAETARHQSANDAAPLTRQEAEDFLYDEAALLDQWRLDEWLTLFTEDARYMVPSTDMPNSDPRETLGLIDDDIVRLRGRVTRLNSRRAHREFPVSRTRRMITNVRVTEAKGGDATVTASFLVYRVRNGQVHPLMGRYEYKLTRTPEGLRIRSRRAELDLDALIPHGTVSIIL